MRAHDFPEANTELRAPEGLEDQVYDLQVWKDPSIPLVISQWKPTWLDRWRILWGKPLWLQVQGVTHPPVTIETDYPFEQGSKQ